MLVFKIIMAVAFVFVGGAKLLRAKPLKDQFEEFGLHKHLILLVGGLEVLGGVGILFPMLTVYAAAGLLFLLFGAVANHAKVKHPAKAFLPAIVLGIGLIVLITLSLI
ncbi:MAG: DoxX family membrane protein [Crocinitomix sp.]|nr:DoxX family membrane protein [Crocinitomix sp.]